MFASFKSPESSGRPLMDNLRLASRKEVVPDGSGGKSPPDCEKVGSRTGQMIGHQL
jgi:hypothetical protein